MKKFDELITSELPVFIDFYAEWCAPCKTMEPQVDQLAKHYWGKVKVVKVNIENYLQEALKFQVRGVPTLVLLQEGKVIWQHPGTLSFDQMKNIISEQLNL